MSVTQSQLELSPSMQVQKPLGQGLNQDCPPVYLSFLLQFAGKSLHVIPAELLQLLRHITRECCQESTRLDVCALFFFQRLLLRHGMYGSHPDLNQLAVLRIQCWLNGPACLSLSDLSIGQAGLRLQMLRSNALVQAFGDNLLGLGLVRRVCP